MVSTPSLPEFTDEGVYRGLKERAIPGTHHEVLRLFYDRYPKDARILDLGAGTGAFVQRLHDAGYRNLLATDVDAATYQAPVPFLRVDLNRDFAPAFPGRFDVVTAIEVVEHLENVANFFRQVGGVLRERGELVLTTPNIESLPGRLRFLASGSLRMFDGSMDPTHITPLNSYLLRQHAREGGFHIAAERPLVLRLAPQQALGASPLPCFGSAVRRCRPGRVPTIRPAPWAGPLSLGLIRLPSH